MHATFAGVRPSEDSYSWAAVLAADRSVAVVGDTRDELIYALRRAGTQRFRLIPPEQVGLDAPPETIESDFDVVFAAAPDAGDGRSLLAARALLADGGLLVIVEGRTSSEAPTATSEPEGQIEQLERRCAALLRELVECEAALVQSDDQRGVLQVELQTMRTSLGWRVTGPLRWIESLVRRR